MGTVVSSWGVNGQLKVKVETDFPERFNPSSEVYINRQPVVIKSLDWQKGNAIIKLNAIDNAEDADELRGESIEIHRSQLNALPDGQYYHFQLIGLKVQSTGGEQVGEIKDILPMPGGDIYVAEGDRGEILIPAADDIVKSIDLENGLLIIEPIKGLLSLNEKRVM